MKTTIFPKLVGGIAIKLKINFEQLLYVKIFNLLGKLIESIGHVIMTNLSPGV